MWNRDRQTKRKKKTSSAWWCGGGATFFFFSFLFFFLRDSTFAAATFPAASGSLFLENTAFFSLRVKASTTCWQRESDPVVPAAPCRSDQLSSHEDAGSGSRCAPPCLHTTAPPTFYRETRSWPDWCLTEKKIVGVVALLSISSHVKTYKGIDRTFPTLPRWNI